MMEKPEVIQATYDEVIEQKKKRINQYQDAVGALVAQQERRKIKLKDLKESIERTENLKNGAGAKAREVAQRLKTQGMTAENIKEDAEVQRCQAAFSDFVSTLEEQIARAKDLEEEIQNAQEQIATNKRGLEGLLREIEKIKSEKHESVAQIISAKQQKEIADLLNGISVDNTAKELNDIRDVVTNARASAKVAQEMAGTDVKKSEEDYLAYASKNSSNKEFMDILGLGEETETIQKEEVKLPEG